MFEISDNETRESGARIKVVGVGGGGCNAVNTMIKSGLSGVEYIVVNTDLQTLTSSLAPTKVQIGVELTKGLGAGANPEVGRKAALDEYEKLSEVLQDADMVFVTSGMGGGTGTGAAPVIAKLAKELGALTVGVVTKPFIFEGRKRTRHASEGIKVLEENVDSLISIPNQKLLNIAGQSLSLIDTFKKADEVLLNAVRGISDLISNTGHINVDFADVRTVMIDKGLALMGTGTCSGDDRAIQAATEAISSPLLDDISIDGATGIVINITGDATMSMHEVNQAVTLIMEAADEDAEIIFGTVVDENVEDELKITVVATGLRGQERVSAQIQDVDVERKPEPVIEAAPVVEQRPEPIIEAAPVVEQRPEPVLEAAPVVEQVATPAPAAPAVEEENRGGSSLVQSIREAASRYEATKTSVEAEAPVEQPAQNYGGFEPSREQGASRAKSIAEKLGFMDFDEDELDKPTFMRRDNAQADRDFH